MTCPSLSKGRTENNSYLEAGYLAKGPIRSPQWADTSPLGRHICVNLGVSWASVRMCIQPLCPHISGKWLAKFSRQRVVLVLGRIEGMWLREGKPVSRPTWRGEWCQVLALRLDPSLCPWPSWPYMGRSELRQRFC